MYLMRLLPVGFEFLIIIDSDDQKLKLISPLGGICGLERSSHCLRLGALHLLEYQLAGLIGDLKPAADLQHKRGAGVLVYWS